MILAQPNMFSFYLSSCNADQSLSKPSQNLPQAPFFQYKKPDPILLSVSFTF